MTNQTTKTILALGNPGVLYANVLFVQDWDAEPKLAELMEDRDFDGAITYLAQWDNGDSEIRDELGAGRLDEQCVRDEYVLTWNFGMRYVGLCRVIMPEAEVDPLDVPRAARVPDRWMQYRVA